MTVDGSGRACKQGLQAGPTNRAYKHGLQTFYLGIAYLPLFRLARSVVVNGDTANKIGTLSLCLAAHHFGVPFFIAAPTTTLDPELPSGASIEIEQRPTEVRLLEVFV
jgi:hypothetical protein